MLPDNPLPWLRGHLTSYHLRRTPSISCGVLVIGSGVAGCAAALAAAEATDVLLLTKRSLFDTNTSLAQGGIAAAVLPEDSPQDHLADTLATGAGLVEEAAAGELCARASQAVALLRGWGVSFDMNEKEELDLHREGGHNAFRVLHSRGDSTGHAIQEVLAGRVVAHPAITCLETTFVLELLVEEGECRGALVSSAERGVMALWAERVILASGGGGQIFRETTNLDVATADGLALAFRAGATLRDLEFVQFHPTALYVAGAARFLISEAVRGAGGVLRDRAGRRFMLGLHPRAELAPRDVVSRATLKAMVDAQDTHVYLDLTGIPGDPRLRFPGIAEVCASFGIDLRRDFVPVRPAAHYFIGGVRAGIDGLTDLPGLFAVGEVASTGLHGANRLASNSLLEGALCGFLAGQRAGSETTGQSRPFQREVRLQLRRQERPETELNVHDMVYSLKALMGRHAGIERDEKGLSEAEERLLFWCRCLQDRPLKRPRTWELANMLLVSLLLCSAARWRRESRGVHYRSDHSALEDARFRVHSTLRLDPMQPDSLPEVQPQPVGAP